MDIETIRSKLAAYRPARVERVDRNQASVAVVLREGPHSAELLLIERAAREGDPWSGDMAFPGGRLERGDDSSQSTAARETFEEVGVDLSRARYLGRLDDRVGNPRISPGLLIATHAFHLEHAQDFMIDEKEVRTAFWFPITGLLDEARHVEHVIPQMPDLRFPGIVVGLPDRHIVWGLTFRILDHLLEVLGRPFVQEWGDARLFRDR
jgi:8-oxo-dGTP pyrophosphatase MutT (NUDIX family)